jgi:pimeloyl-ACP methyl ester carboxylesterase
VLLKAAGLEYEVIGSGEPVLFIHAGFICDFDLPLMSQPALASYQLIRYHRRGFAGSDSIPLAATMVDQAGDARSLLKALDIRRAHIVGHSYGGAIALQLAKDAPEAVRTLVLSEPALQFLLSTAAGSPLGPGAERSGPPDPVRTMDAFMSAVCGPDWREVVDRMVPGASDQADRDAVSHAVSAPALGAWRFDGAAAERIRQPVLSVLGTASGPLAGQIRALLHSWLPQTQDFNVEGANHLLQLHSPQAAQALAEGLAAFFSAAQS